MPAPSVLNSHFFSKFLLRNWESGKDSGKRVWFYDFDKDAIGNAAARSFLVSDTPFPDDVEKLLKDRIEDPLGTYVARSKKRQPFGLAPDPSPREDAAIALALSIQAARTSFAAGDGNAFDSARELLGSDEKVAQVVAAMHQNWAIIDGTAPETERLFLTSTGLFPVFCSTDALRVATGPTIGVGIPLHPRCFIAMVPRGKNADDLRQIIVEKTGMITAMSVGLRGHRVVIPPHYDGVTPPTRALALVQRRRSPLNPPRRDDFLRAVSVDGCG